MANLRKAIHNDLQNLNCNDLGNSMNEKSIMQFFEGCLKSYGIDDIKFTDVSQAFRCVDSIEAEKERKLKEKVEANRLFQKHLNKSRLEKIE